MRQNFRGVVVSALNPKTVKVRTTILHKHPKVLKTIQLHRDYMAHDETNSVMPGDVVRIEACRPMSATKRFAVAEVLKRSTIPADGSLMRADLRERAQREFATVRQTERTEDGAVPQ